MWTAYLIQSVTADKGDCAKKTTSQFLIFSLLIREHISVLLEGHYFFFFFKLKHNTEIGTDSSLTDFQKD